MTNSHITRRTLLRYGAYGAGAAALAGTAASWDRLTGADIPGRDDGSLVVATLGPAYGPEAIRTLTEGFRKVHPDIKLRINAVQAVDWSDFFAKILTQIAAGTAPDLVYVATEGVQLFAQRLGVPLDRWVQRDAAELKEYFADVHPSLVESMMYEGHLYQLPVEFNAADMYLNRQVLQRAGADFPAPDWTRDDFTALLRAMKKSSGSQFTPYFWTNRLWGGVVPWLFAGGTNLLTESKAPGGAWLWDSFYPAAQRQGRGGGFRWTTPQATAGRVEEAYDYLASLIQEACAPAPRAATARTSSACSPPAGSASHRRAASGPAACTSPGCRRTPSTCSTSRAGAPSATSSARPAMRCCAPPRSRTRPGSSSSTPPAGTP